MITDASNGAWRSGSFPYAFPATRAVAARPKQVTQDQQLAFDSAAPRTSLSDHDFKAELLRTVPSLRGFAVSLVGSVDRSNDLLQETLMKAWAHRDSFQKGTNIKAWLYTILRNEFYSSLRKGRLEVEDADGILAANMASLPNQESHLDLNDLNEALQKLPPDQREALLLVAASDLSYEEAAAICKVAVGTIKSRVNRARNKLADMLGARNGSDFSVSPAIHAALGRPRPDAD
jgi:RNA polymerase sigma-70 factor, ECF subfamily